MAENEKYLHFFVKKFARMQLGHELCTRKTETTEASHEREKVR